MTPKHTSRRAILQAGLSTGLGALGISTVSAHTRPKRFRVRADGGGLGGYEFTVSGSITQISSGDTVTDDGTRARGHVGPKRGTDMFRYSGELTGVTVVGPATATKHVGGNWQHVDPMQYPNPDGTLTADDFATAFDENVIKIKGGGGHPSIYEFRVTGSLSQRNSGDHVGDSRAVGHVGAKRGTDVFEFTGNVGTFNFVGPGTVIHNGAEIRPSPETDKETTQSASSSSSSSSVLKPVTFNNCHRITVKGEWEHVAIHAEYPTYSEYLTWGSVNGGPRTFKTPTDDNPRAVVRRVDLYTDDESFSNQNPAVQVMNSRLSSCRESF